MLRYSLVSSAIAIAAALAATTAVQAIANAESPHQTAIQSGDSNMAIQAQSATLKVPGATIYYEKRGSGPVLLIIPGGPQDAGVFDDIARPLAEQYTVVTYDPRGNSRSKFDGDPEPLDVDIQADDAAALIRAAANGPAYVFGTSGGAQIGFNLAARHPGLVTALIAHEPPTTMLLDDPLPALAANRDLYDLYREEGVDAAMAKFFTDAGLDGDNGPDDAPEFEMPPEAAETFARVSGNFEYWLANGMLPLSNYVPEIDTLKAGNLRIMVAIGEESAGQPIHEMASAAARELGIEPTPFPGDHMGFGTHADAFADAIQRAIEQ